MGQPKPTASERRLYFQHWTQLVGGGTTFAFGLLVVLLTKDNLSAADGQALFGLAVAIPGWVLLWFSLNDMERHWHGKTPRLIMNNKFMGMILAIPGTLYALYSLMDRVSPPWLIVTMFGIGLIAMWRMWLAMDLPVSAEAKPTQPQLATVDGPEKSS